MDSEKNKEKTYEEKKVENIEKALVHLNMCHKYKEDISFPKINFPTQFLSNVSEFARKYGFLVSNSQQKNMGYIFRQIEFYDYLDYFFEIKYDLKGMQNKSKVILYNQVFENAARKILSLKKPHIKPKKYSTVLKHIKEYVNEDIYEDLLKQKHLRNRIHLHLAPSSDGYWNYPSSCITQSKRILKYFEKEKDNLFTN
jgi:hypothetical protein